jgi:hypothetical protein
MAGIHFPLSRLLNCWSRCKRWRCNEVKVSPKNAADKRAEAWEVCLAIERAENHAKNGTLTEQQAKKIISEIVERTTGEPLHNYKVRDWLNHWLDMKEQVRSGKTMDRYRQVIRDFIASLGSRANLALAHITPKDVLTYRNSIVAANKTARTANLSIKVVSAALNAALRQGYTSSNPATAVESLPVKAEERATFAPAQVSKLVRAADGDWRGGQFFSAITLAHGLATLPTCDGRRLIGPTKLSDSLRAKRKNQ